MLKQWTRHERPDGRRSLWFNADRWRQIEDCSSGGLAMVFWNNGCSVDDADLPAQCGRHGCPTPTAADLAWLRRE